MTRLKVGKSERICRDVQQVLWWLPWFKRRSSSQRRITLANWHIERQSVGCGRRMKEVECRRKSEDNGEWSCWISYGKSYRHGSKNDVVWSW